VKACPFVPIRDCAIVTTCQKPSGELTIPVNSNLYNPIQERREAASEAAFGVPLEDARIHSFLGKNVLVAFRKHSIGQQEIVL
jgi:hypothetical protein